MAVVLVGAEGGVVVRVAFWGVRVGHAEVHPPRVVGGVLQDFANIGVPRIAIYRAAIDPNCGARRRLRGHLDLLE